MQRWNLNIQQSESRRTPPRRPAQPCTTLRSAKIKSNNKNKTRKRNRRKKKRRNIYHTFILSIRFTFVSIVKKEQKRGFRYRNFGIEGEVDDFKIWIFQILKSEKKKKQIKGNGSLMDHSSVKLDLAQNLNFSLLNYIFF